MKTFLFGLALLTILAGELPKVLGASAADGAYKVTEQWTVTLYYKGFADQALTDTRVFRGSESGVVTVVNGGYTVVNRTGFQFEFLNGSSPSLTNRSISFDAGRYAIGGGYPFVPAYANDAHGLAFLGFFAVRVPLVDGEVPVFFRTQNYSASGTEASIQGGGNMIASSFEAYVSSTIKVEPLPFVPLAGAYGGLFFQEQGVQPESSGSFGFTLTESGAYSGKLVQRGTSLPFTGQFDREGRATNSMRTVEGGALRVEWALKMHGQRSVTGIVASTPWQSALSGEGIPKKSTPTVSPLAGKYTFVIPGVHGVPTVPGGDGFGAMTVAAKGTATLAGSLADGTKYSGGALVSPSGLLPVHIPLYRKGGALTSWVEFDTNRLNDDVTGRVSWIRPPGLATKSYTNGFSLESDLSGSTYRQPRGVRVLAITNGVAYFEGGGLPDPETNAFVLSSGNKVTGNGRETFTASFTSASGLFKGTKLRAEGKERLAVSGVVLQKANYASGFFLRSNVAGLVIITGSP